MDEVVEGELLEDELLAAGLDDEPDDELPEEESEDFAADFEESEVLEPFSEERESVR